MSTGTYDYTRDDHQANPEDFELGGFAAPKSADAIENENSYLQIPPGEHDIEVKGFPSAPKENVFKVFLDGQLTQFYAHEVAVEFCLPGQPGFTVRDFFVLPPRDPREHRAYFEGKSKPDDKKGGFQASKFLHFIDRIGFGYPPGGTLPPEACRLGNWKGRLVHATIEPGKPYVDKQGNEKQGYNRIKLFSFRHVEGGPRAASPVPAATATTGTPAPVAPAHAAPAQAASVAAVLDNL